MFFFILGMKGIPKSSSRSCYQLHAPVCKRLVLDSWILTHPDLSPPVHRCMGPCGWLSPIRKHDKTCIYSQNRLILTWVTWWSLLHQPSTIHHPFSGSRSEEAHQTRHPWRLACRGRKIGCGGWCPLCQWEDDQRVRCSFFWDIWSRCPKICRSAEAEIIIHG